MKLYDSGLTAVRVLEQRSSQELPKRAAQFAFALTLAFTGCDSPPHSQSMLTEVPPVVVENFHRYEPGDTIIISLDGRTMEVQITDVQNENGTQVLFVDISGTILRLDANQIGSNR